MIRLGIIGCGRVSWERHLPALRHVREIEVAAVCDSDPGRIQQAKRGYTNYRELLTQPDIDAVAVLTPTGSHCEIGVAALNAGKHVFMEKPLALNLDECDRLIQAHARSERIALLCFNLRWHRLVRQAKAVIASGKLGRIKAIRSVYTHDRNGDNAPDWHRKLALGGGVSFNEAVHHFDLWRYLTGLEVLDVHSQGVSSDAYEDETSIVSAKLSDGVLASGVFSFRSGPNSELEIFGSEGRLLISLYSFDGLEFYSYRTYPGDLIERAKRGVRSLLTLPALMDDMRSGGSFQSTFVSTWQHFAHCVRSGAQPECRFEDGRQAVEIATANRA